VSIAIRGEDVRLFAADRSALSGIVTSVADEGPLVRVILDCGFPLIALVLRPEFEGLSPRVHDRVGIAIDPMTIRLIPHDQRSTI